MTHAFAQKMDIYGPIAQARRCLDLWLREERRDLDADSRGRAAALIARYFLHEDEVNDALMLSFLRHYSGRRDVDMEDPASVRMEIKTILDTAAPPARRRMRAPAAFAAGIALTALSAFGWTLHHRTITPAQQAELQSLVRAAAADDLTTAAAVWADIKRDLGVRRYQDIPRRDYPRARGLLEKRLGGS